MCRVLNIKRNADGSIPVLHEKGYVLTLDFLLKMITIHERRQCGVPVVLLGETGVGKTYLLETMCSLYNISHEQKLKMWRDNFCEFLKNKVNVKAKALDSIENFKEMLKSIETKDEFLLQIFIWFQKSKIFDVFNLIEFHPVSRKLKLKVSIIVHFFTIMTKYYCRIVRMYC